MKTYINFLITNFFKAFFYVFLIIFSLSFIINLLSELDFFKEINVDAYYPIYMSLINSPSLIFEMFPFIFLISTQVFFINLFNQNQIEIFKYSGLKNSKILLIITVLSIVMGLVIISLFYNFSSNLKNFYLELKSNYTTDGKYLAVITKNGLWIKDKIDNKILIINASKINKNFLEDSFISEFDENYEIIRNIESKKIDIKKKEWVIHDSKVFKKNNFQNEKIIKIQTNFDYSRIQSLFSNLSSLSFIELIELRDNYKSLNYSITEVNVQIHKLISYPIYLLLMTILSAIIMFNTKSFKSSTLKISIGLFLSVIIFYINNFFNVLGTTEKISYLPSVWIPLIILTLINLTMIYRINEK